MTHTLLLLILCVSVAGAQEYFVPSEPQKFETVEWGEFVTDATRDSLISWWDQYKAVCWRDSIRIDRKSENFRARYPDLLWTDVRKDSIYLGMLDKDTTIIFADGMVDCGFKTIGILRYRTVRGRATFEGFMEFLRRKK